MEHTREVAQGLHFLVADIRWHVDVPTQKLRHMQEIHIGRRRNEYSEDEIKRMRYFLEAVAYKFHLTNLSLEQLWARSDDKSSFVWQALENGLDRLDTTDNELLAISFAFEGFLLQARTLLDFYMLYVCNVLKTNHKGSISYGRFLNQLAREGPFPDARARVSDYFGSHVFGISASNSLDPKSWGALLQSLRDKIAHRDRITPSFRSNETLIGGVLVDWPILRKTTYDRFCQYMLTGMFSMLQDVSSILYGLEWKPGPDKPDLWPEI